MIRHRNGGRGVLDGRFAEPSSGQELLVSLSPSTPGLSRISVVIANHNHERFVGQAVDSALDLLWPDVEVVVVDDGSTDGSLRVLGAYGEKIKLIALEKASQREAANTGFAASSGDAVIFLDADDLLPAGLPQRLAEVWRHGVSKVQFQAQPIDVRGRPVARPYPRYRRTPTPAQIRYWSATTSAYPTPPGSGNAYARWYLEKIFPLDSSIGSAADSGCLAAAPFLGDVVALSGVLIGYRWHRGQLSDLLADDQRFVREVAKARGRWRMAQRAAGVPEADIDESSLFRSRELLQFRVTARRLAPAQPSPLAGECRRRLWHDVLLSPSRPGPEPVHQRVAVVCWCAAVLLAPEPVVRQLVRWRYRRA